MMTHPALIQGQRDGMPSSPKTGMSRKPEYGKVKFRLIKSQVRGSYAREKVNEHFPIVSGDCTLHDDSYGCFAVANASIDREIWTNKGDLARVTKYGNILMRGVLYINSSIFRHVKMSQSPEPFSRHA